MINKILVSKDAHFNIIHTDLITSMGAACRPAQALKRNNLRVFSSPFDWMMEYKLSTVIDFINNGFDKFFLQSQIIGTCGKNHIVKDELTGMIAMHSFPKDKTIEEFYPQFIYTMKKRFARLINLFKEYTFCFLMNRNDFNDIEEFIYSFEKKYRPLKVINILDNKIEENKIFKINNSIFYNIQFDDGNINGRDRSNPDWWLGNVEKWDSVLSKIIIKRSFNFNVNYDDIYMK